MTSINALPVPAPELHKAVEKIPECKLVNSPYTAYIKGCLRGQTPGVPISEDDSQREKLQKCAAGWGRHKVRQHGFDGEVQ